jgi:hypothetical protein
MCSQKRKPAQGQRAFERENCTVDTNRSCGFQYNSEIEKAIKSRKSTKIPVGRLGILVLRAACSNATLERGLFFQHNSGKDDFHGLQVQAVLCHV